MEAKERVKENPPLGNCNFTSDPTKRRKTEMEHQRHRATLKSREIGAQILHILF